jgi:hypothetical protein
MSAMPGLKGKIESRFQRSFTPGFRFLVHLPATLLAGGAQGGEKSLSIQVVPKNLVTPIPPAYQMIDSSFVLDSQLARHRQLFDPIITLCQ